MCNLLNGFLMCVRSMCNMHFAHLLSKIYLFPTQATYYALIEMPVIILNKCLANLLDLYFSFLNIIIIYRDL